MRFGKRLAILVALSGPVAAANLSYVTTTSSIFSGSVSDNYDFGDGPEPASGQLLFAGRGRRAVRGTFLEPVDQRAGPDLSSVTIGNGVAFDPQNGISGSARRPRPRTWPREYCGPTRTVRTARFLTPRVAIAGARRSRRCRIFSDVSQHDRAYGGHRCELVVRWKLHAARHVPGTFLDAVFCFQAGTLCAGNGNSIPHGPIARFTSLRFRIGTVLADSLPSSGWVSGSETAGNNSASKNIRAVFAIPNGTSTDTLNAFLWTSCLIATCDFSHTATLSIGTLPGGVSFDSSSGVLLSADSSVPEPATWSLLLCAALALAAARRTH